MQKRQECDSPDDPHDMHQRFMEFANALRYSDTFHDVRKSHVNQQSRSYQCFNSETSVTFNLGLLNVLHETP